ncbi:MAG TPA: hypothetical protein VLV29_05270 [Steroidobacteraceae bacterium]|nr:hypothetical protein [Steroidobacteraceae bacterium]
MHRYQPSGRSFLAAFAALYLVACAHSPPPPPSPPQPLYRDVTRQATATVEVAEPVTRLLKLHTAQGSTWLRAGPEVRNFNQIKVGDTVTVTYYMAIAAQLTPKGAAPIPQQMAVGTARALPGERPAGGLGTTVVETVTIQSVDKEANTVTFLRQDGTVDTASVHSSEGRTFIAGLHSGDQVDVALSEAVAISVDAAH